MRRTRRFLRIASVAAVFWVAGPAASGPAADAPSDKAAAPAAKAPAFRYSKRDLAAYYKPVRLHGVDWFEGIGAARIKNERLKKADSEARLIFQIRTLGALDGST